MLAPLNEREIAEALAEEFDSTFTRNVSGVDLTYITGEQCTSRLNEVLGIFNWTFEVLEHGINADADEIWALGQLKVWNPADRSIEIVRQQFGSQKLKRRRADNQILDIGFDLKGAATDAMKKCATLVGVGLYLSKKETVARESAPAEVATTPVQQAQRAANVVQMDKGETYVCEQCDEELKEIRFRDGTTWTPALLASYGRRKHNKVLCIKHYREANEIKKKAEQVPAADLDSIPF